MMIPQSYKEYEESKPDLRQTIEVYITIVFNNNNNNNKYT